MPDPQTGQQDPQVQDPGFIVTTAEIQTYAYTVDRLIHDINARVLDHEGKPGASTLPMMQWAKWVKFRIDWEAMFAEYKAPGWIATWGDAYEKIRGFHLETLRWKDRWTAQGVDFGGVVTPQPGTYHIAPGDILGGISGFFSWPMIVAAGVAAYMLTRRT